MSGVAPRGNPLTRLQSETCGLSIPEIDLVLQAGTLGGRFTTLEGILDQVFEELSDKVFAGDSAEDDDRSKFDDFLSNLKAVSQQPPSLRFSSQTACR